MIWFLSEKPVVVKNALLTEKEIGPKFKDMCFGANHLYKSQGVKYFKACGIECLLPQLCTELVPFILLLYCLTLLFLLV